ncbi:MAG: hypothetical protein WC812_02010 [Candidatus Pacearchaeota archaeon]|jgi:hypothetical protein
MTLSKYVFGEKGIELEGIKLNLVLSYLGIDIEKYIPEGFSRHPNLVKFVGYLSNSEDILSDSEYKFNLYRILAEELNNENLDSSQIIPFYKLNKILTPQFNIPKNTLLSFGIRLNGKTETKKNYTNCYI